MKKQRKFLELLILEYAAKQGNPYAVLLALSRVGRIAESLLPLDSEVTARLLKAIAS